MSFTGTWTATPVTRLQHGDRVQWYAEVGVVLLAESVDDCVRLRLSLPNRVRPMARALPDDFVLMVQRAEEVSNA